MAEGNDPKLTLASSGNVAATGGEAGNGPAKAGGSNVAVIDQALWKQLGDAESPQDIAPSWLALQCKMIPGTQHGVIILGDPDDGPFSAVAYWPNGIEERGGTPALISTAEKALSARSGVVHGKTQDDHEFQKHCDLAYPFIIDGKIYGVVAIEIAAQPKAGLRKVMRQLQWGAAWMENIIRRRESIFDRNSRNQATLALDLVAAILDQDTFDSACTMVASDLATRLNCSRVSIGFTKNRHTSVKTLSHTSQFAKRMNLIRSIAAAMDEAIDQNVAILHPLENKKKTIVTYAHSEFARELGVGSVLTIPFAVGEEMAGALTFERPQDETFTQAEVDLCDCVVTAVGPMLVEMRRREQPLFRTIAEAAHAELSRFVGSAHYGRKVGGAVLTALIIFLTFAKTDYRVTADARLEGLVQRAIVAPFNGYVLDQFVRAGDIVTLDQLLASLDGKELKLERLGWEATRQQHIAEQDRALAEHNRAEANIIKSQIEQSVAQMGLLDEQLARAELHAPFDGLVVSGDLSQAIGTSVQRGDLLFEIAPLDAYRVILDVDETDISEISIGQSGSLLVSSIPDEPLDLVIEKITPISDAREGRNFFQVEARLQSSTTRLRPGMEGVGKVEIEQRHLIWVWTHKIFDWLRLWIWEIVP